MCAHVDTPPKESRDSKHRNIQGRFGHCRDCCDVLPQAKLVTLVNVIWNKYGHGRNYRLYILTSGLTSFNRIGEEKL